MKLVDLFEFIGMKTYNQQRGIHESIYWWMYEAAMNQSTNQQLNFPNIKIKDKTIIYYYS